MIHNLERFEGRDCHVVVDTDKGKLYGRGEFGIDARTKAFRVVANDGECVIRDLQMYIYTIQLAKKDAPAK